MIIVDIKDREKYNALLSEQEHCQFLQSWEWGEFQESVGNKVFRLGVEENGKIVSALTLIKKSLPLGLSYLYWPKAEIGKLGNWEIVIDKIKEIVQTEKCIFLRFEPVNKLKIVNCKLKIERSLDVQPSKTLILDLNKSEDELLKNMHPKTRYNIRLAEKKGIVVETRQCLVSTDEPIFEEFWKLMKETETRDGFRLHDKKYYMKMLNTQHATRNTQQDLKIKLVFGKYKGKIIAGNIVAFFGDMATYVHGASSNEHRNLMAPYALQWYTIREAKANGLKYYDFYGIDEEKWPGVTRFKKGFSGDEVVYPGAYDLLFEPLKYKAYNFLRRVRRSI